MPRAAVRRLPKLAEPSWRMPQVQHQHHALSQMLPCLVTRRHTLCDMSFDAMCCVAQVETIGDCCIVAVVAALHDHKHAIHLFVTCCTSRCCPKVETIGDCYFVAGGLIKEDECGMAAVRSSYHDPMHAEKVFMFAKVCAHESFLPVTWIACQVCAQPIDGC